MRSFHMLVAFAAALTAGPAQAAREKPDQPKEKKICRSVQMSGRITPQRICRKVERPRVNEESPRNPREPDESAHRKN